MRLWIMLGIISIALLLAGCGGGPGVQAYYRGKNSYQNGQYEMAFANYLYAARQDVTPAQYAVAYQYYYGIGTKRDQVKAVEWLERAAPHSERAQYALHLIEEDAPLQPWTYHVARDFSAQKPKDYGKQCVVSVKCLKAWSGYGGGEYKN